MSEAVIAGADPEAVHGWTPRQLELFLRSVAARVRRERETAIVAGWTAEYCARRRELPGPGRLIEEMLPAPDGGTGGPSRGASGRRPIAAMLRGWARAMGARRGPPPPPRRRR